MQNIVVVKDLHHSFGELHVLQGVNLEVKKQQDTIYCLMENVINGLKNFVSDFLKGMVGNLLQMPLCAAEQFISGLNKSGIKLDRKVLADIAYNNPEVFKSIVKKVQSSLN